MFREEIKEEIKGVCSKAAGRIDRNML